jgi:hypothetical protein
MGADFQTRLHDMLRAFGASGSHWDAALLVCGDRFLLARPVPSSSPMACFAHVRGLGSHSCFARPYHAARGLGSQALRQRAVVASSILDAPSRHGCRRGHPSSEGRVGELLAHRD